jgi:hypothetical protein
MNLKKSSHQWLHFLHKINKKYECRTGPFEGFFVSSVEFCKFNKFDDKDRKDIRYNRTGTQGPTRAHLALRVHQVHNASQLGTVEASCDLEDIAISGGAEHFFLVTVILFCLAIFHQPLQIAHGTDKSNLMGLSSRNSICKMS